MGEILFLIYVIGLILSVPIMTRFFAKDFNEDLEVLDGGDWAACVGMAFCMCWMWPLVIPGWLTVKLVKGWE